MSNQPCTGHTGHYEMDYSAKRRLLVCDVCGRNDFVEIPYEVGPGGLPEHTRPDSD